MSKEHWWNDTDRLCLFFLLETHYMIPSLQ